MSFAEFPGHLSGPVTSVATKSGSSLAISGPVSKNSKHVVGALVHLKATTTGATPVVDAERLWRRFWQCQ